MSRFVRIFKTSVGCKAVMALTGFALVLFVIQHCLANLQIYKGQDAMNAYAAFLKGLGVWLWVARGGLLAVFLLHIFAGIRLYRINTAARQVRYQFNALVQEDPLAQVRVRAAIFMFLTGMVVLMFVLFHLAHFTFGWVKGDAFHLVDAEGRHDVYSMFILGFQNPIIAITYMLLMLVLGAHLIHGFSSAFQSLGLNHPTINQLVRYGCPAVVIGIILLNIMMPFTILFLHYPALPEEVVSNSIEDNSENAVDQPAADNADPADSSATLENTGDDNSGADNTDVNNAAAGKTDGDNSSGQEPPVVDPPTGGGGGQ